MNKKYTLLAALIRDGATSGTMTLEQTILLIKEAVEGELSKEEYGKLDMTPGDHGWYSVGKDHTLDSPATELTKS